MPGMSLAAMPFLMIGFFIVVMGLIVWIAAGGSKRATENLVQLATTLGLTVTARPPLLGLFQQVPRVSGEWRGKRVEIFPYTTGSGKSQQQWCAVSAAPLADGGLIFTMQRQGLGTKVMELFGAKEIQVGDAEFDRMWFIQTNQPDFFRVALLPELRGKIDALASETGIRGGRFQLEKGAVRYAEQGSFFSPRITARIGRAAEIVVDLADLAEVYATTGR